MGVGMASELHPDGLEGVRKKFQMTNLDMPNKVSSMKYALESVPGLPDVGVPHGGWGWPQSSTQMYGAGLEKVSND